MTIGHRALEVSCDKFNLMQCHGKQSGAGSVVLTEITVDPAEMAPLSLNRV